MKIELEDINVKSVRYPEVTDQKFEKIALKLGRTKRRVFIQMVDYFYKSKKDGLFSFCSREFSYLLTHFIAKFF